MNDYLLDMEFAVQSLFDLVTHELNQISNLEIKLKVHRDRANLLMAEAYYVTDQDVDDLETPGMYARRHGYARHISTVQAVQREISKLEASYHAKDNSIRVLCGSILQIAKQGISFVHRKNIPTEVIEPKSGEPIASIIWQGRNQSMHYEEGKYQETLISCFAKLEKAFDSNLNLTTGDNKAKHIVFNVLGWRTYSDYLTTMTQLLT